MSVMKRCAILSLLPLLAAAAGCAGAGSPYPAGALSMAPQSGAPAVARPAAAPDPAAAEAVGRDLPMLRGVRGDDQLRTLRWMAQVADDRRLVALFEDLRGQPEESLDRRAAEARQRLDGLITGLERAGHRASEEAVVAVADADPNAPPPNWFPPAMIEELEKHAGDPEAARALEEARKTSPRGTRPPG